MTHISKPKNKQANAKWASFFHNLMICTTPDKIHFEARSPNIWAGQTDIHTVSPGSVASVTIDPEYQLTGEAALPRPVDKMLGADISFLPQLEDRGIQFKDKR